MTKKRDDGSFAIELMLPDDGVRIPSYSVAQTGGWALAVFKNLTHARLIFHCARDPSIDVEDEAVHLDYRDLDRLVRKMRAASVSTSGSPPRRRPRGGSWCRSR